MWTDSDAEIGVMSRVNRRTWKKKGPRPSRTQGVPPSLNSLNP